MASRDNNNTPESSDYDGLSPASEPMIIDGKVVNAPPLTEIVDAELVQDGVDDPDAAPPLRVRNGLANAGMLAGIASLILNPYGVTSVIAVVLSIIGLRRAIAMFKAGEPPVGRIPATIGLALGVATTIFAAFVLITLPSAS